MADLTVPDIGTYLQNQDVASRQAAMAKAARRSANGNPTDPQDIRDEIVRSNQNANKYQMLQLAAGLSGNETMAKAVTALNEQQQQQGLHALAGGAGWMDPVTGAVLESPIHAADRADDQASRAMQALTNIQAQNERAQERAETQATIAAGNQQTRMLLGALAASSRQQAESDRQQRMAQNKEQYVETKTKQLSDSAQKDLLPQLIFNANQIADSFSKYTAQGKDVPGLSTKERALASNPIGKFVAPYALGDEGMMNLASLQGLANDVAKAYYGSRITLNEQQAREREALTTIGTSGMNVEDAFNKLIAPKIDEMRQNLVAGYDPEVVQRYTTQGGRDLTQPVMRIAPRPSSADQVKATVAAQALNSAGVPPPKAPVSPARALPGTLNAVNGLPQGGLVPNRVAGAPTSVDPNSMSGYYESMYPQGLPGSQ